MVEFIFPFESLEPSSSSSGTEEEGGRERGWRQGVFSEVVVTFQGRPKLRLGRRGLGSRTAEGVPGVRPGKGELRPWDAKEEGSGARN